MGNHTALAESALTGSILNSFFKVFNTFGPGLSESIYMNALEFDLVAKGHSISREVHAPVYFGGRRVGRQRFDMVVDDKVIVEGKSTEKLLPIAVERTKAYLRISKFEVGLLLHFGLKPEFQRFFLETSSSRFSIRKNQAAPVQSVEKFREPYPAQQSYPRRLSSRLLSAERSRPACHAATANPTATTTVPAQTSPHIAGASRATTKSPASTRMAPANIRNTRFRLKCSIPTSFGSAHSL